MRSGWLRISRIRLTRYFFSELLRMLSHAQHSQGTQYNFDFIRFKLRWGWLLEEDSTQNTALFMQPFVWIMPCSLGIWFIASCNEILVEENLHSINSHMTAKLALHTWQQTLQNYCTVTSRVFFCLEYFLPQHPSKQSTRTAKAARLEAFSWIHAQHREQSLSRSHLSIGQQLETSFCGINDGFAWINFDGVAICGDRDLAQQWQCSIA